MDTTVTVQAAAGAAEAATPAKRLDEVLRKVRLELVGELGEQRGRGCDPYDAKLGRQPSRSDVWGRRRRPA